MPPSVSPLFGFLFGAPLSALGAAAGAVAIPIVIHLLNRRRFRVVTWAAMRFLLNAERKNARRMRLEQLILLGVRCLIVLLLVLAMASIMPWAESMWAAIFPSNLMAAGPNSQRTHKILVIDGSFSMAMRPEEESYFERARGLANQIVQESPRGDGFSVVLMASPARCVVTEASEDAAKVSAEIQGLKLPHGNADLASTLSVVEDLLRHSPDKFVEKEVYFLTDVQRSTWIDRRAPVGETLERFHASRKIFVDVGRDGMSNTAVTNLALGVSLPTTRGKTPIMATIHQYGPEKRGKAKVQLWVGRARAAAGDAPLEMRLVHDDERELAAGPNTVSFPYQFTTPGDYVIQVRVDGDKLDLDDVRSAVVRVKDNVPVMLVNGKPATDPLDTATEFLKTYLDPSENEQGPLSLFARPKVIPYTQFRDASTGDLSPYDCVYFCDVPSFSLPEVRRLETHLRAGGGVVICLGKNVDPGSYNDALFRNGKGILPGRLLAKQQAPPDCFFHFSVENKDKLDPPLDAFAGGKSRVKLLEPEFYTYYRVEPAPDVQARKILTFMPYSYLARTSPAAKKAVDDLRQTQGDPALLEWQPPLAAPPADGGPRTSPRSRGRVVLITTTVNEDWNNWCKKDDCFLTLIDDLTRFAVAGRLREHAVAVGDPLEEYLQSTTQGQEAEIRLPDGRKETVRAQAFEDSTLIRWADTDQSGLYVATIGQSPTELAFAVNVPTATETLEASESDPARATADELRRSYPEWELQIVTDPHEVNHATGVPGASPEPSHQPIGPIIARWLLLTMFGLLLVEVVLAWRFGHYSAIQDGAIGSVNRRGPRRFSVAVLELLPYALTFALFAIVLAQAFVLAHYAWTGDFLGFVPDGVRRFGENVLGIPAPAAGEGSQWRLEFFPYLWDAKADPWLAGALGLATCAFVATIYCLEGRTANSFQKVLLAGLRICFLLLTLAVLLPEVRLWFERQGWPDVVILLDDSQSMSTVDKYQDPRVQEVADRLAERLPKDGELSQAHRLGLARALVARGDADWLNTLLTKRKFKVHIYHCSAKAARIADVTELDHVSEATSAMDDLRADAAHDSSQLGAAVRQVLDDFRGSSLAAVVMLSDGVTTEGEDLVKASKRAAQMGVPLFFVGMGDDKEAKDLILHDLQVEDTVYVNDRVVFEVRLSGPGFGDLSLPVRLREKGSDKVLVPDQNVKVDGTGKPVKVRFVYQPTEKGEKTFIIDVPEQPGEAKYENNRIERTIFVQESKLIKVLYVEGYPRYEFRFIKNLLERESNRTKGNKSIDLKVFLLSADDEWASQDKSAFEEKVAGQVKISRADFLTGGEQGELNKFDVVIWGDVDPKAYPKMKEHLKNVADFVTQKGGGLLMIAGPQFAPHAYRDTALKDVLPIDAIRDGQPEEPALGRAQGYRPELTPTGRQHPIFRFSPEESDNDQIWNNLKEMRWASEGYKPKRAAEVLAVYPGARVQPVPGDRMADDGSRPANDRALVVQQFMGAGRCLFFGFEETWLWQHREDQIHFNQFWIQTVRYLARSRQGRIEIRLNKQMPYQRGEPIEVTARFPDDAPPPGPEVAVKVTVERRASKAAGPAETEVQTLSLDKLEGSRATYKGVLTNTPEGEYRLWLREPVVPGEKPRAECRVLAPPGEMERLRMNQPDMERAALDTNGRFYTLADADRLPSELPSGTRVTLNAPGPPLTLWNHVLLFLLAILLLTTEWVLRKRVHLL